MNINNLMGMLGGSGNGNNMGNFGQIANMMQQLTGKKVDPNMVQSKLNDLVGRATQGFMDNIVSALYKEYPTDKLSNLFKPANTKEEKIAVLKELTSNALPKVLEKLADNDIDMFYGCLQKKRG